MGTPEFGATILRRLARHFEVVGVVTQPDRPAGRKNLLTPPAVKVTAHELGLPVLQVEKLRSPESQAQLREFARDADVFIVASFGMILPVAVLQMPRLQCLNVHASLLPAYRGASPVAQAILDGLPETGVTIMLMDKGLDTGAMLSKVRVPLAPDETQPTLLAKLANAGSELLVETLPHWANGEITPEPQDHAAATHTGIIKKEAGRVNWHDSAARIERMTRSYDPWPGVYTFWNGEQLKIGRAEVLTASVPGEPGQVIMVQDGGKEKLAIVTGDSLLAPLTLQLPGKKMLPASDFVRGYQNFVGSKLG
jgi:methionyl-tRNA formyltransferase